MKPEKNGSSAWTAPEPQNGAWSAPIHRPDRSRADVGREALAARGDGKTAAERWTSAIMADRRLSPAARLCAWAIAARMGSGHAATITNAALAAEVGGVAGRTIQRALATLEGAGYLERERGSGRRETRHRIAAAWRGRASA
jgi:hypothetical protein